MKEISEARKAELKTYLTKIDASAKSLIKEIAGKTGATNIELVDELEKISKEAFLAHYPEAERSVHAGRILRARYAKQMMTSASPFEIIVLDKTDPKTIMISSPQDKTKKSPVNLSSVYGFAISKTEGAEIKCAFTTLTLWRDEAPLSQSIEVGKVYEFKANGKLNKDGKMYILNSADKVTKFSPVEKTNIPEKYLKDFISVAKETFEEVDISTAELKKSKNNSDYRMVVGEVVSSFVGKGKKEGAGMFGRITMIDASLTFDMIKEKGGLSVLLDPSQVIRYGDGSEIAAIGTITESDEFGVGMTGICILPILAVPRPQTPDVRASSPKTTVEDTPADAVDMSELDMDGTPE